MDWPKLFGRHEHSACLLHVAWSIGKPEDMDPIRAVILDRDGTLNYDAGYTHRIEDFRLFDHVIEGLQLIREMGFRLFLATNQSGIARGYFSEHDMRVFNDHLLHVLKASSITIDGIYFCPYHPTEGIGPWRRDMPCRKPRPGMLLQAARDHHIDLERSYVIGDRKSDILAGRAAGCTTILVLTGAAGADEPNLVVKPDYVACDLLEAAAMIRTVELKTQSI